MNLNKVMGYSAPNLLVLCVDSRNADDTLGRFYSRYEIEPTAFRSSFDLIVKMDEFFDKINFPQSALKSRSFFRDTRTRAASRPNEVQRVDDMMEHKGDLATFVVHVQYRQNATWQGKISWVEKKKECSFRSALEMLKLMNEALGDEPKAERSGTEG